MEPLPGIPHEDLLKLVFSFAVLLGVARLFAEIARRAGLPAVVGEILAGVVLGPSVLSGSFPQLGRWILPDTALQSQLLDVISLIGIMFLLVVVGMETDLALIRARFRTAAGVGLGGLIIPGLLGLAFAYVFPDDLLVDPAERIVFALFLAVALALSAIPVLAKILADMGLMRTRFGQTALAAGMIDDIFGWALLGIVTSLAAAGTISPENVAETLGAVLLFVLATYLVARPLARWSLKTVQERFGSRDMLLTLVVGLAFLWGAFSQALRLEPILGAFAVGILFGQMRRVPPEVGRALESVTFGVFAPVFLATAGLRLSLGELLEPSLLSLTGLLIVVAAGGKLIGAFAGARFLAGSSIRESIGFGVALQARGVLGIIVATIGLSMGILGVEVYSMVVVTSVVTSLVAPIGLKLVFRKEPIAVEEPGQGLFASVTRVLLTVRARDGEGAEVQSLEASVLTSLAAESPAVTLFTVAEPRHRREGEQYLSSLARLFSSETDVRRRVGRGDPVEAILDEAAKGYDLLALGSPEGGGGDSYLFGSVVDEVVRLAPCPSIVFTARGGQWPPRRIMVPVSGTESAARAADLAFALATQGSPVLLFHIVDPDVATEMATSRGGSPTVRIEIGQDIVDGLREVGVRRGVNVTTEVVMGGSMVSTVAERARHGVDLIVVGTGVRAGSQRLFLGPKVELLLKESPCSVLVLNT